MLASSLGLIGLVGAIVMTAGPWRFGLPSAIGLPALPLMGSETIAGKARVVSADQLAIGDRIVRLKGVEVPDRVQRCLRGGAKGNGRTWACGAEAYGTFRRFVQGRAVECSVGRTGEGNVALGSCRVAGVDVGESLVKAGLAFAEAGFASPYRSIEDAARAARAGIWSAASPERPTEWRNRLWTMAKLRAPEGCPIKGRVQGGERIYVLPWSSNYGRVRVNKRRGERWFCTEEEAIAAGWRSPGRG
jgi:endonuclease YncB( thermonuclease family)